MTRIIRVSSCETCPYCYEICPYDCKSRMVCRHPEYFDEGGDTISRSLEDDYPGIPRWCPLKEEGPSWSKEVNLDNVEFVPIVEYVGNDEYVTYPEGEPPETLVAASNDVLSELIDRAKAGQKRVRIGIAEVPK